MMKRLNALENGCEEGTEGDVEEERRVMALTELKGGQHFCCVTMQLYFFFYHFLVAVNGPEYNNA